MPVSIKPAPIIKGEAAKKILKEMENPAGKTELFKKCKEASRLFTMVNK
ncbi:MAG: hypothetical protein GX892_00610 [Thermoanaerobacteraceae bacterium]|nr:hypothetical protein [Thermoanaerobacteraceae bacterium]